MLVELWATWCPPCRSTLHWVGDLKKRWGDRLAVIAIAVESRTPRSASSRAARAAVNWVIGTPDLVRAFGDVSAVPTLLLFDKSGRSAAAFYGAPPLHAEAEKLAPVRLEEP